MNLCFPFSVNPAQHGSKKASFVCLFAAKNLVRKSQWGDKYCQKLYRISQGDELYELYESLYLTKREERSIFHALWEN